MKRVVRIGGASAHWNDSIDAVPQLLRSPVDYLILDYLSEGALSVMARMKRTDPESGYAADFATQQIGPHLAELKQRGVKVIANAGGMNPRAAAKAIRSAGAKCGVLPRIAIVLGDDHTERQAEFRKSGLREMFNGRPFPREGVLHANTYLGAFPIAAALNAGADIVITGRVSDSALALGPLITEFGWTERNHDLLAAGTLVGHLLECGRHATGGTFTDWREVADGWEDVGFPIAECSEDGTFVLTKPEGTGGLVSRGTVAEQMLYEITDPQAYVVADVVCDFSEVEFVEAGPNRVLVTGARGYPPTGYYKLTVSTEAGWRGFLASPIVGFEAADKAQLQGKAILARVSRLLKERNLPPFTSTRVEALGAEATLGAHAINAECREVVMRVTADHPDQAGAQLFVLEQHSAMTSMSVGAASAIGMGAYPLTDVSSYLLPRDALTVTVEMDGKPVAEIRERRGEFSPDMIARPPLPELPEPAEDWVSIPLIRLAWGRSGDKGGTCNIGVIARRPEFLPYILAGVTEAAVAEWMAHCFEGSDRPNAKRYFLPGSCAVNFVLENSLGGAATVSNRLDTFAKTMAQQLLAIPVMVPPSLAETL